MPAYAKNFTLKKKKKNFVQKEFKAKKEEKGRGTLLHRTTFVP